MCFVVAYRDYHTIESVIVRDEFEDAVESAMYMAEKYFGLGIEDFRLTKEEAEKEFTENWSVEGGTGDSEISIIENELDKDE